MGRTLSMTACGAFLECMLSLLDYMLHLVGGYLPCFIMLSQVCATLRQVFIHHIPQHMSPPVLAQCMLQYPEVHPCLGFAMNTHDVRA